MLLILKLKKFFGVVVEILIGIGVPVVDVVALGNLQQTLSFPQRLNDLEK
jgi:hypothetical protein